MIIGYARVSTTEQNLGLDHDDLKPADVSRLRSAA
jgi:DNA invertase Pin-like site-specific DNA recombinase